MTWKAYRLVYQAKSPIHIGWHTLGYIKLTRYYIPGKTMWGAMTANLTRTYGPKNIETYKVVGSLLKTDVRIGYFYTAINLNNTLNLLMPRYTKDGLIYGDINTDNYFKDEFERAFVSSFGQTAILPESNTAEDESLHESEYISPGINKGGKYKTVFFVGYVFIKEGASLSGQSIGWADSKINVEPAIRELFVGGDMKYGWGRLKLQNNPEDEGCQKKIFGYEFMSSCKSSPCIEIPKGSPVPAHLNVESGLKIKGDIEPLVGREWRISENNCKESKNGAGQRITEAEICWMPGSVIEEEKKEKRTLEISAYGILRQRSND